MKVRTFEGDYRGEGLRIAVVVSRFNDLLTEELLKGALDCFKRHGVEEVHIFRVPGSFEIPITVKKIAKRGYDAILALGVLIKGETRHFELVASQVSRGIAQVSLEEGIPVIFGIVPAEDEIQAISRSGIKSNRGFEYALTTIEMANLFRKLGENNER
ncbi:6,7-dimethyl-8-ribityllumazine synthase [Pyrococcus furiosus DSM 3638]|uniref:6,7-dimethyl-8-ribityllumazine synthase n=3 Tax=Pyrococcus furiosus TaxID=2261 RepID=RISB_PYRFU|nr:MULTISPECIES: 6,7-dimethyl-8-ribityllumazine synthase [Pyrococcus]Q8U4L8.1 RecName: Full=6,7-dimethyl-8-ribityllumazine synthase; Short=DMRL synthase; Short=LS; Short=Lumazine synthase [Pyrococcus furiosus DSM 3638]AAL80187.1 6,7-dimethyl-8-ribityllumazine synthase [Pyrococcus furiosus DSM 3638]AFN04510.1 6,7-dimethyl-8-ribityllumazine synthase [Pyrococcus furiosus COM1]MDK2870436.1 6,7-dimethyl-8-ribityllumazine synthase [Pyrococcus sp.]QEK77798.1 6,7-dimethyl-8-ribityllumazine synthase [P